MANHHLVILKKPYLEAILAGKKRIESRLNKIRRSPFGQVLPGDKLFLKESSGPVRGVAIAAAVENFENLTPRQISELKQRHNHQICGNDEYWRSKMNCKFGLLVWLEKAQAIEPVQINKEDWRAWVVLTKQEDFGLLEMKGVKRAR